MKIVPGQGFMSEGDEKTTSFEAKSWLGSSIRREIVKALANAKTVSDFRSITLNFSNQAFQDEINAILAEIETAPKKFTLILPPVYKNDEGENTELPEEIEKKIDFEITEEEYINMSGFRKFFLTHAPGELKKSVHAIGDSIGELAFLEGIKDDGN